VGSGAIYECTLKNSNRRIYSQNERYLTEGWYEFVRDNKLRVGDKLLFCLNKPTDKLFVRIVRRSALG
jgi:hypothetical protein